MKVFILIWLMVGILKLINTASKIDFDDTGFTLTDCFCSLGIIVIGPLVLIIEFTSFLKKVKWRKTSHE